MGKSVKHIIDNGVTAILRERMFIIKHTMVIAAITSVQLLQ